MLDPVADLKLHQLDLVEAIHERQALMQARSRSGSGLGSHEAAPAGPGRAIHERQALMQAR